MKSLFDYQKVFGNWMECPEFVRLINSGYFKLLIKFVKDNYKENECFPVNTSDIFNVFKTSSYKDIKVVILGDKPYYNVESNGYAFASNNQYTCKIGCQNVRNSIENYKKNVEFEFDFSLKKWTNQKVLLLNRSLTISKVKENNHVHAWNKFNAAIINIIIDNNPGVIFALWGKEQSEFLLKAIPDRKLIHCYTLECNNPKSKYLFKKDWSNDCFNKINAIIEENNGIEEIIKW
jgi:uracil-DNA glycosylase